MSLRLWLKAGGTIFMYGMEMTVFAMSLFLTNRQNPFKVFNREKGSTQYNDIYDDFLDHQLKPKNIPA
jgi:hypothetical protein